MSIMNMPGWPGWETGRLIGRGSFGAVYEIKRDVFGDTEKAALKVISIPQNDGDIEEMYSDGYDDESITSTFQSHLKSIVAEYSLMRKMNGCANIVNCDDVRYVQHEDSIGWDIFIKMELLTPLTKALPADISEQTVRKIAKDMCAALEVCKKFDIVHRDIKPQNIFVSDLGDYKLGDFGIAKTVEKTMGGTKIGTYKYMAPEVYNNQPYGSSADIYSLGLVLYWLLNEKRMPFLPLPPAKLGAGLEEKARMRRFSGEALPAPAHGSRELQRIVLKACAFDPKERYASAADMMADLLALDGVASPVAAAPIPAPKAEPVPAPIAMPAKPEPIAAEDKTVNAFAVPAVAKAAQEEDMTVAVAAEEEKTAFVAPAVPPAPPAPATVEPTIKSKKSIIKRIITAILIIAMAVLYFSTAEVYIARIITGNVMIDKSIKNDSIREIIYIINSWLGSTIHGWETSKGIFHDQYGISLNPLGQNVSLFNACILIIPAIIMLVGPPVLAALSVINIWIRPIRKLADTSICKKRRVFRIIAVGTAIILYALIFEQHISRMITGIIMIAYKHVEMRTVLKAINVFLVHLIGGTRNPVGVILNRTGQILNSPVAYTNMRNAIQLIVPSLLVLLLPVVAGVTAATKLIVKNIRTKKQRTQ